MYSIVQSLYLSNFSNIWHENENSFWINQTMFEFEVITNQPYPLLVVKQMFPNFNIIQSKPNQTKYKPRPILHCNFVSMQALNDTKFKTAIQSYLIQSQ